MPLRRFFQNLKTRLRNLPEGWFIALNTIFWLGLAALLLTDKIRLMVGVGVMMLAFSIYIFVAAHRGEMKEHTNLAYGFGVVCVLISLGSFTWLIADPDSFPPSTVRGRIAAAQKSSYHVSLDLSQKGLKEVPPEVWEIPNISSLDLSGNRLTEIPPEIACLENLTSLRLSDNRLESLPPEIGSLPRLSVLEVTGNRLTALPPEIGNLTALTILNLSDNRLTALPAEIGQLSQLRFLTAFDNQLTTLPARIGNLAQLEGLALSRNQINYLPAEMGGLNSLGYLYLNQNQLTDLPAELADLPKLEMVTLDDNPLGLQSKAVDRLREHGIRTIYHPSPTPTPKR